MAGTFEGDVDGISCEGYDVGDAVMIEGTSEGEFVGTDKSG